jgi:hypothetical protein
MLLSWRNPDSRQHLANDMSVHVRQPEVAPLKAIGEPRMIAVYGSNSLTHAPEEPCLAKR